MCRFAQVRAYVEVVIIGTRIGNDVVRWGRPRRVRRSRAALVAPFLPKRQPQPILVGLGALVDGQAPERVSI